MTNLELSKLISDLRVIIWEHHNYDVMSDRLCVCPVCSAPEINAILDKAIAAEAAVIYEKRESDRYKRLLDFLIAEQLPADESQVEFSGPVYLCTAKSVQPGRELEALERFIKEVTK